MPRIMISNGKSNPLCQKKLRKNCVKNGGYLLIAFIN